MAAFPEMTKEAQDRVLRAVEAVVDMVEQGEHPTSAVVKVASDESLPAGHIPLVATFYNLAAAESHRKQASDLSQRLLEFPLADGEEAQRRVYPGSVKSAGAVRRSQTVSEEYSRPPDFLDEFARNDDLEEKWASYEAKTLPRARPESCGVDAAWSQVRSDRDRVARAKTAASLACDAVSYLTGRLTEELKHPSAPRLSDFSRECDIRYGRYGTGLLKRALSLEPGVEKAASRRSYVPSRVDRSSYNTLRELVEAAGEFGRLMDEADRLEKEAAASVTRILAPHIPTDWEAPRQPRSALDVPPEKAASILGPLFGTAVGSNIGRQLGEKIVQPQAKLEASYVRKLTDPQHEAELRNINVQSMLSDLMANDDHISGYDPAEILNHFNELSQIAPRASEQPAVVRAFLRKRLQQGAMDPYETDMLAKMENTFKKNMEPQGGAGASSNQLV